jgi:hypothetical protein
VAANGTERLDYHGGRRVTVPGVGLVEITPHNAIEEDEGTWSVRALEPLSPAQEKRLALWLQHEWRERREGFGGY